MMIGDERWNMMKTVAVRLERWLSTARQGYMPLVDSDEGPKFNKPVRNRRAIAFNTYPTVKPPGSFTMEILPKVDGTRGRRARLRQRIQTEDEEKETEDELNANLESKENVKPKTSEETKIQKPKNVKKDQKNSLPQHLSSKNNNVPDRLSLPKNNVHQLSTPKRTLPRGRRAVLKQELTPTGELYSYTTPHKCYICGKTCYLPFTYQPFIRMNNNYIEVTQYNYDDNANIINEEDVVTVINAEREYRYRKDLTMRNDNEDLPIIVLAFDSEIRSSRI